ncbi:MAG: hypothetical protein K1000chlam3_00833 [Chlamydiae bacterium]|nr:hypothetical protein [Chlamydiota bacterium]
MTSPVQGGGSPLSLPYSEQYSPDFTRIFQAILSSGPNKDPNNVAQEILTSEEIIFLFCSIEDYEDLENLFIEFLKIQKASLKEKKQCMNVLDTIYVDALYGSFLRQELLQLHTDFDSLSSLAHLQKIKQLDRNLRTVGVAKKREFLGYMQRLRPYLNLSYCQKLLILAHALSNSEELNQDFPQLLDDFFSRVQDLKDWIPDTSQYYSQLFINTSEQKEEKKEEGIQQEFIGYSLFLLEALGECFLEKFVPANFKKDQESFIRANEFWDKTFKENVEWMDLVWKLISEFTPDEKKALLEKLFNCQKNLAPNLDLNESMKQQLKDVVKKGMRKLCKEALKAKMQSLALNNVESLRRYLCEKK